jgi:glycosyltransferase involved in cell wall biosynthesis
MKSDTSAAQYRQLGAREMVHLAVGSWGASIGGPYQTVQAYRLMLSQEADTCIVGIDHPTDPAPAPVLGQETMLAKGASVWPGALAYAWRARHDTVVVFGVWHPVFFSVAFVRIACGLKRSGRRVLVPTQSLSPWDWAKHRAIKVALKPLVAILLKRFDQVIFATEGERLTSIPEVEASRGLVIYHPIQQIARQESAGDSGLPRIVFLGRIAPQKNLELFIEVLAMLPASWTADIVGDGDDKCRRDLERHAERLQCADRVRWHGWLSREFAHSVVTGADALVVTSRAENYCHAAVEAMALGVPVIMVDRVAAATDMQILGTGVVVHASATTLASAIEDLRTNDDKRTKLIQAGWRFAENRSSGIDAERLRRAVVGADE